MVPGGSSGRGVFLLGTLDVSRFPFVIISTDVIPLSSSRNLSKGWHDPRGEGPPDGKSRDDHRP